MSHAAHPRRSRMTHRISDFALLGCAWVLSRLTAMERDHRTRERWQGIRLTVQARSGKNPEGSSGAATRDGFAEAFKQTFKVGHSFPEHQHFGA